MKTNIVLIGFLKDPTKQIAKRLALDFDLYFADVEGMLEYNLTNENEIENLCGIDYLNGLKKKVLKDISSYENTLIAMPYSIFIANNNYEMFKENCTIVFLNYSQNLLQENFKYIKDDFIRKTQEAFLIAYEERTQFCKENSNLTIDIVKPELDTAYKRVKKFLDDYYL